MSQSLREVRMKSQYALDTSLVVDTRLQNPLSSEATYHRFKYEPPTVVLEHIKRSEDLFNDIVALKDPHAPSGQKSWIISKFLDKAGPMSTLISLKEELGGRLPEKSELLLDTLVNSGTWEAICAAKVLPRGRNINTELYRHEAARLVERAIMAVKDAATSPQFRRLEKQRRENARHRAKQAQFFGQKELNKTGALQVIEVIFTCTQRSCLQETIDQQIEGLISFRSGLIRSIRKYPLLRSIRSYMWRMESKAGRPALRVLFFASLEEMNLATKICRFTQSRLHDSNSLHLAVTNLLDPSQQKTLYCQGYPYGVIQSIDPDQCRRFYDALYAFGHAGSMLTIDTKRPTKMYFQGVLNESSN